jgi:hypothetical protein
MLSSGGLFSGRPRVTGIPVCLKNNHNHKGDVLRKFLLFVCTVVVFASFARAQQVAQIDVAGGGSTLFSSKSTSASEAFLPPPIRGGVYPSLSADVILDNHFGFNAEGAFRFHQGIYDDYQKFRPIFYDVNGMYTHRATGKIVFDFLGGVGGESLIFYNKYYSCPSGSCRPSISANHFLLHAGIDFRYYLWRKRHVFVRPEAHYYRIIDNTEFNSGNILRLGASVGYTFGR